MLIFTVSGSGRGFRIPFGPWARDNPQLREKVEDRIADFRKRCWLQPGYIDRVRAAQMTKHETYYGKILWTILMLEEWLDRRVSNYLRAK